MTINQLINTVITLNALYAVYLAYKAENYAKKLEKENIELQKLLKLPNHLQFKTINKAYKNHAKRTKNI
jgi:hypothetical protein